MKKKNETEYYAVIEGVLWKGMGCSSVKDCSKACDAKAVCTPCSEWYRACHAFGCQKLRKVRKAVTLCNK
ncbi:MAG: hypothetical protein J6Y62_05335 [Clostridia bacterium]|nr:hypothetical protein [Clostridia bacterium]